MTVMVDEVRRWPHAKHLFGRGSCHLTADSLEELHAFAVGVLGMRREWFQDVRVPHYDLTPARRLDALGLGATFVPAKEQARRRRSPNIQRLIDEARAAVERAEDEVSP